MERKNQINRAILYDPLFPRKNISVTLLSSYCYFNSFIRNFIDEVYDNRLIEGNFFDYQDITRAEIIKDHSENFIQYLLIDQTKIPKFWDTFCFILNSPYDESTRFLVKLMKKDPLFCLRMFYFAKLYSSKRLKSLGFMIIDVFYMIR